MVKTAYKMILLSLLCLLLPLTMMQTCANVGDPSYLLQAGKIQVFNAYTSKAKTTNRFHTYSVAITYPLPSYGFQISSSIGSYTLSSLFNNVYDFSVRAGKGNTSSSAQIVLFINQDATWTTLQINYLISSRNDLFLGSFIADGFIFQSTDSNQLTVKFGVPSWTASNQQIIGVTEFSGMRTFNAQSLLLSFANTTINPQTGVFTVVMNTNTAFEYLYLTYYWWINGPSLTFSSQTTISSLLAYQLIGIDSINGTQLTYSASGFNVAGSLSCNGANCPEACVSSSDCQNYKGIISGDSCFLCGVGQTFNNNNCQNTVTCSNRQYFDGSSCVCSNGYELVNGSCLPSCGENAYVDGNKQCQCLDNTSQQPNKNTGQSKEKKNQKNNARGNKKSQNTATNTCNKTKICGTNQVLINNTCQCEEGYAKVNGICSIVYTCPGGAIWNPSTFSCVCSNSQYFINGVCRSCPANSAWNGTSCNCLSGFVYVNGACSNCPANSQWNGVSCSCISPYNLINGVCAQCPQNSAWNGTTCVCLSGFSNFNGACLACPTMSVWVSSQQSCVCLSGYYMVNGACITCPLNEGWNGTNCVCLSGFYRINGVCTQCSSGLVWTGSACVCPNGQYFIAGSCQSCPQNTAWNGTACACVQNYYLVNGNCLTLPANSYYNGTAFVCNPTFYLINNICSQCWANSQWNGSSCVCLTGFYASGNSCLSCPANSAWNGQACVCLSGFYAITSGTCSACQANSAWNGQACICLSGFYLSNGACISCQPNSSWNGTACNCLNGYYLINGACSQCSSGMVWNGSACGCSNGQYLISGTCQVCPQNTAWNGTACACINGYYPISNVCQKLPANSYYNGTAFVCNPNYYLINNTCLQCWANSAWNGSACACLSGYYPSGNSCVACGPNSAWNGQSCVCLSGFYAINNGPCSACQANSAWNGQACICLSGFNLFNGSCIACQANSTWNGSSCVCLSGFYLINGSCLSCPSGTSWNGSACVQNCPPKSAWNGTACNCVTNYYLIQGSCLPCDTNSVYNSQLLTCTCNLGYFGNYQLCTACDSSCVTCSAGGPNGCSSCKPSFFLNNNQCQACSQNCLSCSDAKTCTQCADNYTLSQQVIGGSSVTNCAISGSATPGSLLSLTGTVVDNGIIYQGVTLSTLPTYFLVNNCVGCSDLFLVNISPSTLGITYSVSYVLYSQYWFVINFSFGSTFTPTFNFSIQINPKYSAYFTAADLNQTGTNSISSIQYPAQGVVGKNTTKNINKGGQTNTKGNQGIVLQPPSQSGQAFQSSNNNNSSSNAITPNPSATSRTVIQNGAAKQFATSTLNSLFN